MGCIAVIPAAGRAIRMGGLPKFLLPTPDGTLLSRMTDIVMAAGVPPGRIFIGSNLDNFQLTERNAPAGAQVYLGNTNTMSQTVLDAKRWATKEDEVLFGMPDTYFATHANVFTPLRTRLEGSDVVATAALWAIREDQRGKLGMVTTANGRVVRVEDKSNYGVYAWGALAWKSAFWQYIQPEDPHVGYAIQRAIEAGEKVAAVRVYGDYYDCGTREEYFRLCATWGEKPSPQTPHPQPLSRAAGEGSQMARDEGRFAI